MEEIQSTQFKANICIEGVRLTEKHIGKLVAYKPRHDENKYEYGIISSFRDNYVFVIYNRADGIYEGTAQATTPSRLIWVRKFWIKVNPIQKTPEEKLHGEMFDFSGYTYTIKPGR